MDSVGGQNMPRGDNPNSRKNLKPQNKRTKEEQRDIAIKGGKASGESRRQRKTLKEELLALLSEGDIQESIALALVKQAVKGNNAGSVTKAFEVIRDTIGEKPVEKVAVATANEEAVNKLKDAIAKRRAENGEANV